MEAAAECCGEPSKFTIVNIFELAQVVENGNVSFGESVTGIKK
jgi:hypothetical protein